jgi:hypothetical protein
MTPATLQLREMARAIREDRISRGLSVDKYYDQVLGPYLDGLQDRSGGRCSAMTYYDGRPFRQCLRAVKSAGLCYQHLMLRREVDG